MPGRQKTQSPRQRAGLSGGETTRDKYGMAHYQAIGSLGGKATMARHAAEYAVHRRRGGQATKRRYGREHFRRLARRSAEARQAATLQRDAVIQEMLADGWKIPTIIQMTFDDLPGLMKYLMNGLGHYLQFDRPETESPNLFVSKSGRPLTLANTYKVMQHKK